MSGNHLPIAGIRDLSPFAFHLSPTPQRLDNQGAQGHPPPKENLRTFHLLLKKPVSVAMLARKAVAPDYPSSQLPTSPPPDPRLPSRPGAIA